MAAAVLFSGFTAIGISTAFPDEIFIGEGERAEVKCPVPIRAERLCSSKNECKIKLSLPSGAYVKTVSIKEVKKNYLIPAGIPFGIKMFTKGVVVVGLSDIDKNGRLLNPAKEAGIKCGDIILEINNKNVSSNEDISKIINTSQGRPMTVKLKSKGKEKTVSLVPLQSSDGFKAGMWVRDSSAGIGTMTYYDPVNNSFAGLGHPVCDADTGIILPIDRGKAVNVNITGVNKGRAGTPGELRGTFGHLIIGELQTNKESGVFGKGENIKCEAKPIEAATKDKIHTGAAYILTTTEGNEPNAYKIEIERISCREKNNSKNMIIKITDEKLLEKTGGIVQGMSGSPILQDGRLVGAVTHVLVNDPTRGYGIFIENMLETEK